MKTEFPQQIFGKVSDIKFNQNPSSVRAELFHAYLRTDGRTDMTELIVAFRNFANAPQIHDKSKSQTKKKGRRRTFL